MQGLTSLGNPENSTGSEGECCLQAAFSSWTLSRVPGTHSNKWTGSFTDVRLLD